MISDFQNMAFIKNLLFDFGGVFYQIEPQRTYDALKRMGIPVDDWLLQKNNVFLQLERGEISSSDFVRYIQVSCNSVYEEEEIIQGFTSMLIGLPLENLRMLTRLRRHYNCLLVSNTSELHYQKFYSQICASRIKKNFFDLFTKEYYSFQIGLRKPEPEIFNFIIRDSGIKPHETLFVDDDQQNIKTAKEIGFKTFCFGTEGYWHELIKNFNLLI